MPLSSATRDQLRTVSTATLCTALFKRGLRVDAAAETGEVAGAATRASTGVGAWRCCHHMTPLYVRYAMAAQNKTAHNVERMPDSGA